LMTNHYVMMTNMIGRTCGCVSVSDVGLYFSRYHTLFLFNHYLSVHIARAYSLFYFPYLDSYLLYF
jgi:hypothetical protein